MLTTYDEILDENVCCQDQPRQLDGIERETRASHKEPTLSSIVESEVS